MVAVETTIIERLNSMLRNIGSFVRPKASQHSDRMMFDVLTRYTYLRVVRHPAILRRVTRDGKAAFLFVGLCFVDGWMYGEATFGQPEWQTAILY